jgi:hypothetical protein
VAINQKLTQAKKKKTKKNTRTHRNTKLHDTKSLAIINFIKRPWKDNIRVQEKEEEIYYCCPTKIVTTELLISFLQTQEIDRSSDRASDRANEAHEQNAYIANLLDFTAIIISATVNTQN